MIASSGNITFVQSPYVILCMQVPPWTSSEMHKKAVMGLKDLFRMTAYMAPFMYGNSNNMLVQTKTSLMQKLILQVYQNTSDINDLKTTQDQLDNISFARTSVDLNKYKFLHIILSVYFCIYC